MAKEQWYIEVLRSRDQKKHIGNALSAADAIDFAKNLFEEELHQNAYVQIRIGKQVR